MKPTGRVVLPKKDLKEMASHPFETKIKGKIFNGFVVKKRDRYYAYQNLCRHLPVTLDLKDNRFFTQDKKFLQCHMHGAMYEVETGYCIAGPCQGASLLALKVEEIGDTISIVLPEKCEE